MYIMEEFLDLAIKSLDQEWTSEVHKETAGHMCLCNPRVRTMDDLMNNIGIINKIPEDEIKLLTFDMAEELGCRF